MGNFKEYKRLDLSRTHKTVLEKWNDDSVFKKSLSKKNKNGNFTFYEGPPSANGMPGIHHVIARTIKDLFCRYKTLQGYHVGRKAGWDTHGLPVELGVEKELNITKEDIGKSISIQEYNALCKKNVMKYKASWEKITNEMGYWVDMENPYMTYDNKYIESVWWLLKQLHNKRLLYKGHTIQPFSPKAGTGLSTHELNQPGCYRNVKDVSATAQFKLISNSCSKFLFTQTENPIFLIAWTTTPWTLPSNTALAVGKKINYLLVETINKYTGVKVSIIVAKDLLHKYFKEQNCNVSFSNYKLGDKDIPYRIVSEVSGERLSGLKYEQLMPYSVPKNKNCFVVVTADFVTTEDGTGIVHIAPSFGSDDNLVAKANDIGSLTLVDKQGRFKNEVTDFAGMYVKDEYYSEDEKKPKLSADIQIVIKLKKENKCFNSEKYEHSYPHCWRTDKPILYYPMDSWFVKTSEYKNKMMDLNRSINWKPKSTGEGRFGNWLENLLDWNLSRSRFWGIPIPIWRTKNSKEEKCIGSLESLKHEINLAVSAGLMNSNPLEKFNPSDFSEKNYSLLDLHRPFVDNIILVSDSGEPMYREPDLIDVWFDSGAMPYAQLHYPFENKTLFDENFPADFIAEGVDQTRGWFFTLHAISSMVFDSVAFKNVVSNGLVLDKNGNKMSKRLENSVDPFEIIDKYGGDSTRWYMIANAQPWDNLKFDEEAILEVQRKFFGTLYNTYSFFALYANIDSFNCKETKICYSKRHELDRWILSELHSLVKKTTDYYEEYEPTQAARAIQDFVINKLSNWYVRLSRRRFWKGDYTNEKISAYQSLYECLETIAIISSPIAPFFMDRLYTDLNSSSKKNSFDSVHLASFPKPNKSIINAALEEKMFLAQKITTIALSLRKQEKIRVRQPLSKIMIPVLNDDVKKKISSVKEIILSEINVKEIQFLSEKSNIITKKIKPNFKILGPKYGSKIKYISSCLESFSEKEIALLEEKKSITLSEEITLAISDVDIFTSDIPGSVVASDGNITVSLDIVINKKLKDEGYAREFVNRIQNIRKQLKFNVTDKISIKIQENEAILDVINNNLTYICNETLAEKIVFVNNLKDEFNELDLTNSTFVKVLIKKIDNDGENNI